MENLTVYDIFKEKKRIGKSNDGGYVINILPGEYDIFISGGIAGDISFEEHLLTMQKNLICHAFDGTILKLPKSNKKIIFHKKNLGYGAALKTGIKNYQKICLKISFMM